MSERARRGMGLPGGLLHPLVGRLRPLETHPSLPASTLQAAQGAGMRCVITYTSSTAAQVRSAHGASCCRTMPSPFAAGSNYVRQAQQARVRTHVLSSAQAFDGADAVLASLDGVAFADLAGGAVAGRDDRAAAAVTAA